MRALKISQSEGRSTTWPAVCVLLVVFQWFAWQQVGLNTGYVAGWLAPADSVSEQRRSMADFATDQTSETEAITASEFCRVLPDWPLPGCNVS